MFRERAFRSSPLVLALFLTTVELVAIPFVASPAVLGLPVFWAGLAALLAGIWTFSLVVCRLFPLYVGPDGLRSYNGVGIHYDVPWAAMRSVGKAPGYLLVRHGRWGSALCVPVFLSDQAGFAEYVRAHAPEDNPLRRALEH